MDLERMAARVAADPKRKVVFTKKGSMDSESPGRPRLRSTPEMEEYLAGGKLNAVLIESSSGWVAVYRDSATGKYAVSRVPVSDKQNLLGDKIPDPASAVDAALQLA